MSCLANIADLQGFSSSPVPGARIRHTPPVPVPLTAIQVPSIPVEPNVQTTAVSPSHTTPMHSQDGIEVQPAPASMVDCVRDNSKGAVEDNATEQNTEDGELSEDDKLNDISIHLSQWEADVD